MTYQEAARILDPEISRSEIYSLRRVYGEAEAMMRVEEATRMGAEALRTLAAMEDDKK